MEKIKKSDDLKAEDIALNSNDSTKENHNVDGHAIDEAIEVDHYHDKHHFDKYGNHDDINEQDFNFKISLVHTSNRNIIYRITLTSVFLALAIACTALDGLTENITQIPVPEAGGMISLRFLDLTIVTIAISSIGPIYASGVAFIIPVIHWAIHPEHAIANSILECFSYALLVWYFWLLYYVIFKNSIIHKDANRKKDLTKRYLPIVPYVLVGAAVFALLALLGIYLTQAVAGGSAHSGKPKDEDDDLSWDQIKNFKIALIAFFVLFGFESLRLTITYTVFSLIDPSMKKINHRYR